MKTRLIQSLSLLLAVMLQIAPLLRSVMSSTQGLAPSTWAIVLKIGVGAIALLGFDAVSQASSISISPPNATVGVPYSGVVTYSGGHSGAVASMMFSNICIGSTSAFFDGLSVVYAGGNQANVTGTPTNPNTYAFSMKVWSGNCSGSHSDIRATTLVVGSGGTANVAPTTPFAGLPQNTLAQVGSDVQLSGGTSGAPIPQYQWWQGGIAIVGATNSILNVPNVQLTNAGLYTLTASNILNTNQNFGQLPKANCYLSVCITGGTNYTVLDYTNYAPAGAAYTIFSYSTNVSTATNYYVWIFNNTTLVSTSNTVNFTSAKLLPSKSGVYTLFLSSTNLGPTPIYSFQPYDSYWSFGYPPLFTNQLPAATNLNSGSNVTFSINIRGHLDVYPIGASSITNGGTPDVFWYKNNTLIASQTYTNGPAANIASDYTNIVAAASLTLSNVSSADVGNYTVVVTNYWGSITSGPAVLTVGSSSSFTPSVTVQPPTSLALLAGQNAAISITVTGTPPLVYQWRKGGVNLANGGVYAGVFTNVLTLINVGTSNTGNYTLAITNSTGAITSSVTAVNVILPPALTADSISPGTLQLSGNTATGLTYVVLSTTNIISSNWIPVVTNNTGAGGGISFQTNAATGSMKFYQLKFP